MKVSELIDWLYKCPMDCEVKVGLIEDYPVCNAEIKDVVQVSSKLSEDIGTVYLVHE